MPKKTTTKTVAAGEIDPTSDDVVLAYVDEDGRSARNIPARDLTHGDVARLVYQRSLAEVADELGDPIDPEDPEGPRHVKPDPRQPDPAVAAAVIDELVATGLYSTHVPAASQAHAPETPPVDPAAEPAAPAETPEA